MKVIHNAPLANYTSLHTGGKAETLIELESGDSLAEVLKNQQGQLWILGYGTNCLISDRGLPGVVIINKTGTIQNLSPTRFRVDSGVIWDTFVQTAIDQSLWGLEFTSGIPGGSGAAVTGNIAAYGHKVADSLMEARIFNYRDGTVGAWQKPQFGFSYRQSDLQKPENSHLVVLDATFELSTQPTSQLEYESALKTSRELGISPDTLANRRKIIMETRRQAGSLLQNPGSGPYTAGSFFKNPMVTEKQIESIIAYEEKPIKRDDLIRQQAIHGEDKSRVSAAHVLLAAGFSRGQAWGNVRLHPDHILKIENTGSASAKEIYDVVQHILETVKQKLDIDLGPEVKFLGEF